MNDNKEKTIQDLRIEYGMNLKQLSERFGIPYRTIQNWNSGQRECPGYIIKMMDEILKSQ